LGIPFPSVLVEGIDFTSKTSLERDTVLKMLSLASILNPSPPKEPTGSNLYSPPRSSSPEVQFSESSSNPSRRPMVETDRLRKDLIPLPKSKVKGAVKFFPFEDLDAAALREIRRFRVAPFGSIRNNCRHIPYNSGKKDFFEKTARDSFEGNVRPVVTPLPDADGEQQSSNTPSSCPARSSSTPSCGTITSGWSE
jgi:hypothetical protein